VGNELRSLCDSTNPNVWMAEGLMGCSAGRVQPHPHPKVANRKGSEPYSEPIPLVDLGGFEPPTFRRQIVGVPRQPMPRRFMVVHSLSLAVTSSYCPIIN